MADFTCTYKTERGLLIHTITIETV
jgi:hypothetical protein